MTHHVLYDPDGRVEDLPLDREPHETLVSAVLAWTRPDSARPTDCEQIARQLSGHARIVADEVRLRASRFPEGSVDRALAEALLGETRRRLSSPVGETVRCCQNQARLVRALYARLDQLPDGEPATPTRCAS
jgi:hypothetical protein